MDKTRRESLRNELADIERTWKRATDERSALNEKIKELRQQRDQINEHCGRLIVRTKEIIFEVQTADKADQ